ncbi:hypothetical protein [Synechococcus phage S-N03]|uniref:Uncharacterized protein n=1 Tax=Synechococcus phage S-N03 TaxID=2718943 RepID=A0A6G8R5W1_9CAUD|nr:hypothetical protein PQC09_gp162 [Synechococcus phage S-N03]QIN96797.1 hypothetical protein [Synechococcus phage S-N03]
MKEQPLAVSFAAFVLLDLLLIYAFYCHGGNMHLLTTLKAAFGG